MWGSMARLWFIVGLVVLAQAAAAEPRLFLPLIIEPVPARVERDLRIVSAASGESLGSLLTRPGVMATAMDASGSRLFAAFSDGSGMLGVFSVATGRLRMVELPVFFPNSLALDELGDRLFVGSNVDDRIAEVDLESLQVVNLIDLSESSGATGRIVVDSMRDRLHLAGEDALWTIDPSSSQVLQRLDVQPVTARPFMLQFDAPRDRLYFSRGLGLLEVLDVTDEGLVPIATVEFDQNIRALFLDAQGARLYAAVAGPGTDEGTYAIDVGSIPVGASAASDIDTVYLALPRHAPYMDLDRQNGTLYLVQDRDVTAPLPPVAPGDPMTLFEVDPASLQILRTVNTPFGGPNVPVQGFLSRVDGPNGLGSASVPALTERGLWILLVLVVATAWSAMRIRRVRRLLQIGFSIGPSMNPYANASINPSIRATG